MNPAGRALPTVAVIGGGFSGAFSALQLVREGAARVVVIDRAANPGRGLAYGTPCGEHHVNVIARNMSAFASSPTHLVEWLRTKGQVFGEESFVPRHLYGDYLAETFSAELQHGDVNWVVDEVTDIEPTRSGFGLTLAVGGALRADAVVLAPGHAPPSSLRGLEAVSKASAYVSDPLGDWSRVAPKPNDHVLLFGAGLTAADVVATLRARGHRGEIQSVSRHGLAPVAHSAPPQSGPAPVPARIVEHAGLREITAWLRGEAVRLRASGTHPTRVVDVLRPYTPRIWKRLSVAERRAFVDHLRPRWDVLRHRVPTPTAEVLRQGLADGWWSVRAGTVRGAKLEAGRLQVGIRSGGADRADTFDLVVNCTGPDRDLRRHTSALSRSLLARGLVQVDPLGLGVRTRDDGAAIAAGGGCVPGMFVVGPWRTADLWESTAIPELRSQTEGVARAVAAFLATKAADAAAGTRDGRETGAPLDGGR